MPCGNVNYYVAASETSMPSAESISDLLALLYEAAASPGHWPNLFEALRDSANADSAFFILADPEGHCNFSLTHGFDPAYQRAYADHLYLHDVVYERYVALKRIHGHWSGTPIEWLDRKLRNGEQTKFLSKVTHLGDAQ